MTIKRRDISERAFLNLLSGMIAPSDIYQNVAVTTPFPGQTAAETRRKRKHTFPPLRIVNILFSPSITVERLSKSSHDQIRHYTSPWSSAHIAQAPHYPIHQYHQVQPSYYSLFSLFYRE